MIHSHSHYHPHTSQYQYQHQHHHSHPVHQPHDSSAELVDDDYAVVGYEPFDPVTGKQIHHTEHHYHHPQPPPRHYHHQHQHAHHQSPGVYFGDSAQPYEAVILDQSVPEIDDYGLLNLCDETCPEYEHEHHIDLPVTAHQHTPPVYQSPFPRVGSSTSSSQLSSSSPQYSYLSESRSLDSFDSHHSIGGSEQPVVMALGPPVPVGHVTSPPLAPRRYHVVQYSPEAPSPALSMRSSSSSRTSFTSSTLSTSPAMEARPYTEPVHEYSLPPHLPHARSMSQPVSPAQGHAVLKKSVKPPPMQAPVPALTVHTGGHYVPPPLELHAIPAVDLSTSAKLVATPLSAGAKKRRRDSVIRSATDVKSLSAVPAMIRRSSMTETHSMSADKHFTFNTAVPQQSPTFAASRASPPTLPQRRPSVVSLASVSTGAGSEDLMTMPVLILPATNSATNATPPARRASVQQAKAAPVLASETQLKRRKSFAVESSSPHTVNPHNKAMTALTSMVKLDETFAKLLVVKGVDFLHEHDRSVKAKEKLHHHTATHIHAANDSLSLQLPLHVRVRDFLRSRFSDSAALLDRWVEASITHILWIYERGWSDYTENCPADIHDAFMIEASTPAIIPPAATVPVPAIPVLAKDACSLALPQIAALTIEAPS